jgi:hypothetical protein
MESTTLNANSDVNVGNEDNKVISADESDKITYAFFVRLKHCVYRALGAELMRIRSSYWVRQSRWRRWKKWKKSGGVW